MSDTGTATAEDVIPNLVANTGTFSSLHGINNCRAIRFITAGTFIGLTKRSATLSGPPARTITGAIGDYVLAAFISRTGGTADVELHY